MSDHDEVDEAARGFPAEIDPVKPLIVSAFGSKGSGKSTFNRSLYRSWPFDKFAVDVNGDADPGEDAERMRIADVPARFPARLEDGKPRNLHVVADPGSATYSDDLDRSVALALMPQDRRVLGWFGEVGEFTNGNRTRPHMRRLLMQNRHYLASAIFDGPRPKDIDKLIIGQADLVAVYHLPDPDDRERIAKVIGYPAVRFNEECEKTWQRGEFWYLLWVTKHRRLYRCAPLPLDG